MKTNQPKNAASVPAPNSEAAAAVESLKAAYGRENAPTVYEPPMTLFGQRSAAEAAQIAMLAHRAALPETMAIVCELKLAPEGKGLPELRFLIPEALGKGLSVIGNAIGQKYIGAGEGLAGLLGSCGRSSCATLRAAPPAYVSSERDNAETLLENAIEHTLGILRLIEASQGNVDWVFERNSPVWLLVAENGAALKKAFDDWSSTPRNRPVEDGLLKVLETGTVLSNKQEVAA